MNKLLVICGPTATGKTDFGIKLAKRFNGEIVSADSRQVYKFMDIGTGKDLPKNAKIKMQNLKLQSENQKFTIGYYNFDGIPIWLYDIVKPDYKFNVADYVKCADLVISDIWKRNKLPILVGGTGFYIKGVIDGIETMGIKPDWELRQQLSNYPIIQLSNKLKKTDFEKWQRMNESDRNNPRRLVRAIEIAIQTQNSKVKSQKFNSKVKSNNLLMIGLMAPSEKLYQKIDQRVEQRVDDGVENEIRELLNKGYNFENSVLGTTIGYREWGVGNEKWEVGCGDLKKKIINHWKFDEHSLARRQMTFFKKDKRINWFDINKQNFIKEIEKLVNGWYNRAVDGIP